jgi:phospholipid/cholesterol/gamma-HCH transport system substrate-binding protein
MNSEPSRKLRGNRARGRFHVAPENERVYIAAISTAVRQTSRAPRWVALVALLLVAVVLAWVLLRGKSHEYRLIFPSAGQLVKGDVVRIGGTGVGTVTKVGLSDDDQAEIDIRIKDTYGALHEGTTATIRAEGLTGVASRYVDVSPGSQTRPELGDGAMLQGDKTTSIIEIDQLFDTLDPKTRTGIQNLIKGSADWYDGKESAANVSTQQIPKALAELSALADEIEGDNGAFEQFLVKSGDALGTIADHDEQVTQLVSNTKNTTAALSADTQSLTEALNNVPDALRKGSDTFAALRPALGDLRKLTDSSEANTKDLAPFLKQLTPVLQESTPAFSQLRRMFAQPGDYNDLLDALRELPTTARLTDKAFPDGRKALKGGTPIFAFARPYVPDLVGWISGYDSASAAYDANGHYVRGLPVFNAFTYADDANGGHLTPRPADQRGTNPALSFGNLLRCPGTAAPSPLDRSAPFVDSGDLSNSDCDPSQTVKATG